MLPVLGEAAAALLVVVLGHLATAAPSPAVGMLPLQVLWVLPSAGWVGPTVVLMTVSRDVPVSGMLSPGSPLAPTTLLLLLLLLLLATRAASCAALLHLKLPAAGLLCKGLNLAAGAKDDVRLEALPLCAAPPVLPILPS